MMKAIESFPLVLSNAATFNTACVHIISSWKTKSLNSRTAGPAAWQILSKVAKFSPVADFVWLQSLLEVVLLAGKCLDAYESQLSSMAPFDLDKMLSNVLVKVVDIWCQSLDYCADGCRKLIMDFIRFIARRLKWHTQQDLDKDIRRLSIQADEHVQFDMENPLNDPVLLQLILIAQESLVKFQLISGVSIDRASLKMLENNLAAFIQLDRNQAHRNIMPFMMSLLRSSGNRVRMQQWLMVWDCLGLIGAAVLSEDELLSVANLLKAPSYEPLNDPDLAAQSWAGQLLCIRAKQPACLSRASNLIVIAELICQISETPACLTFKVLKLFVDFRVSSGSPFIRHFLTAVEKLRGSLSALLGYGEVAFKFLRRLHVIICECDLPAKTLMTWSYSILHSTLGISSSSATELNLSLSDTLLPLEVEPEQKSKINRLVTLFYSRVENVDKFLLIKTEANECVRLWRLFLDNCPFLLVDFKTVTSLMLKSIENVPDPMDLMLSWAKYLCANPIPSFDLQSSSELYRVLRACDVLILDRTNYGILKSTVKNLFTLEGFELVDRLVQAKSKYHAIASAYENDSIESQMLGFISGKSEVLPPGAAVNVSDCFEYELLELYLNNVVLKGTIVDTSLMIHGTKDNFWSRRAQDLLAKVQFLFCGTLPSLADLPCSCRILGLPPLPERLFGLEEAYSAYFKGDYNAAMKSAYSYLKSLYQGQPQIEADKGIELFDSLAFLHRLSTSLRNFPEAKYFLKQLNLMATSHRGAYQSVVTELGLDFQELIGKPDVFDPLRCEAILKSDRFSGFIIEKKMLVKLGDARARVKLIYGKYFKTRSGYPLCNGLMLPNKIDTLCDFIEEIENELKVAKLYNLVYCIGEWASLLLHLYFVATITSTTQRDLWRYLELSRRPEDFDDVDKHFSSCIWSTSSVGLLYDHHLETFWIIANSLCVRVPIARDQIRAFLNQAHEICAQNTDSLRNTRSISNDENKTAEWWCLRKELDCELDRLCKLMNETMFLDIMEMIVHSSKEDAVALEEELINFVAAAHSDVKFKSFFVPNLIKLGIVPRRSQLEVLLRMIQALDGTFVVDDLDAAIFKLRRAFESAHNATPIRKKSTDEKAFMRLLLDKHLNTIPFESFDCFSKISFVRVPSWSWTRRRDDLRSKSAGPGTFYILNPSGDLVKTQERFEELFKKQSNWSGIVGRPPLDVEVLEALTSGAFKLFIYFGHSAGESYLKLQDLKEHLIKKETSLAPSLLVGCSSGRIVNNGIFPSESTVQYYLQGSSPLVLANLWDVTDKDIDQYIQQVMIEASLLKVDENDKNTPIELENIAHAAQSSRNQCYLKSLNGKSPVVYGLIGV